MEVSSEEHRVLQRLWSLLVGNRLPDSVVIWNSFRSAMIMIMIQRKIGRLRLPKGKLELGLVMD